MRAPWCPKSTWNTILAVLALASVLTAHATDEETISSVVSYDSVPSSSKGTSFGQSASAPKGPPDQDLAMIGEAAGFGKGGGRRGLSSPLPLHLAAPPSEDASTWKTKSGKYCSGNWGSDWAARTQKSLNECKASCQASSTCKTITVGTYGGVADNCVLCTSDQLSAAGWTTTYKHTTPDPVAAASVATADAENSIHGDDVQSNRPKDATSCVSASQTVLGYRPDNKCNPAKCFSHTSACSALSCTMKGLSAAKPPAKLSGEVLNGAKALIVSDKRWAITFNMRLLYEDAGVADVCHVLRKEGRENTFMFSFYAIGTYGQMGGVAAQWTIKDSQGNKHTMNVASRAPWVPGRWYHMALVMDLENPRAIMQWYIDGEMMQDGASYSALRNMVSAGSPAMSDGRGAKGSVWHDSAHNHGRNWNGARLSDYWNGISKDASSSGGHCFIRKLNHHNNPQTYVEWFDLRYHADFSNLTSVVRDPRASEQMRCQFPYTFHMLNPCKRTGTCLDSYVVPWTNCGTIGGITTCAKRMAVIGRAIRFGKVLEDVVLGPVMFMSKRAICSKSESSNSSTCAVTKESTCFLYVGKGATVQDCPDGAGCKSGWKTTLKYFWQQVHMRAGSMDKHDVQRQGHTIANYMVPGLNDGRTIPCSNFTLAHLFPPGTAAPAHLISDVDARNAWTQDAVYHTSLF